MMNNIDDILRKKFEEMFGADNVMYKGKNSICSTCKHFDGKTCAKREIVCWICYKIE